MSETPDYEPPGERCERVTWPPVTAHTLHDRYCALVHLAHLYPDEPDLEGDVCGGPEESE